MIALGVVEIAIAVAPQSLAEVVVAVAVEVVELTASDELLMVLDGGNGRRVIQMRGWRGLIDLFCSRRKFPMIRSNHIYDVIYIRHCSAQSSL